MSVRYRVELDLYDLSQIEARLLSDLKRCEEQAESARAFRKEDLHSLLLNEARRIDELLGKLGKAEPVQVQVQEVTAYK